MISAEDDRADDGDRHVTLGVLGLTRELVGLLEPEIGEDDPAHGDGEQDALDAVGVRSRPPHGSWTCASPPAKAPRIRIVARGTPTFHQVRMLLVFGERLDAEVVHRASGGHQQDGHDEPLCG